MTSQLSRDRIAASLPTNSLGRHIVVHQTVSSTNDVAWQYATDSGNSGLVVFAEEQTAGRGRHGNKWLAGGSKSILCSVLLTNSAISAELLTLSAAVALCDMIGTCGRDTAGIKWPNDITLGGKKVGGILIESRPIAGHPAYVIGIGINCSQTSEDLGSIAEIATSIELASGFPCDRNAVARRLIIELDQWLSVAGASPQRVNDAWLEHSVQLNKRITLQHDNHSYTGTCVGVDPVSGLIVQLDGGGLRMFDAMHTHTVRFV